MSFQLIDFLQVLDPIDGTRGFVRGDDALYVVCSLVMLNYLFLCGSFIMVALL